MRNAPGKIYEHAQDFLRDIRGKDIGLRMSAIEMLRKSPRKHGSAILELAYDAERDVRVLGCGLIGAAKPAGAINILIEKTRDTEPNVREAACTALGKFKSPQAVRGLTEALQDKTWIAYAAACSLGEIGGKKALQELMKLFRQGDSLKATAACQALLRWDNPDVVDEIVKMITKWPGRKRNRFVRIVLEQGGKGILDRLRYVFGDDLLTHLHDLIERERRTPMRVLLFVAEFANQEAVGLILQELAKREEGEDDFVDILALLCGLHALWKDQPEAYLGLPDEGFVLPMVRACAATRTKIGEGTLRDILSRSSLETKREIALNLTLIAEPYVRLVEGLLFDADDHIKGYAAEAAAFFNMHELAPRIEELSLTGYSDTRQKAFRSLCMLEQGRAQALAEEFVSRGNAEDKNIYLSAVEVMEKDLNYRLIQNLLHSRENRVVAMTVTVIGRLIEHDARYLDVIGDLLCRKKALPEALEIVKENKLIIFQHRLLNLLADLRHDTWTRYQTLSALAVMEDPNLFDVFAAGLKDEHNLIKIASIKALVRLRHIRAADLISPFLKNAETDLRHIAKTALDTLTGGVKVYAVGEK
jgi:HEAT repeat protein